MNRGWISLLSALLLGACFQSSVPGDDGGVGLLDAAVDGAIDRSSIDVDGGMCERLGDVRLCGPYCGLACPRGEQYCNEYFALCQSTLSTPRGQESGCQVDLWGGGPYCFTGRLCATLDEAAMPRSWGGACVGEEYCRWVMEQPDLADVRCRYSDGTLFVDGPPDHECAPGAAPQLPFCGGACGDTCPANPLGYPIGCAGISETRGFGVCVPDMTFRCEATGPWYEMGARSCAAVLSLSDADDYRCACMLVSPVLVEEYAERGWVVARQSCLAYRDRYPGEVRCFDDRGAEI